VALGVGWLRDRVLAAFAAVALALGALWVASLVAFATDFRDTDGSLDYWPGCTLFQDAVLSLTVFALPIIAVSGIVALVLGVINGRRREARPPG
jgi:hypothetical protein